MPRFERGASRSGYGAVGVVYWEHSQVQDLVVIQLLRDLSVSAGFIQNLLYFPVAIN